MICAISTSTEIEVRRGAVKTEIGNSNGHGVKEERKERWKNGSTVKGKATWLRELERKQK